MVKLYFNNVFAKREFGLLQEIIHPEYIPYQFVDRPHASKFNLVEPDLLEIIGISGITTRMKTLTNQFNEIEVDFLSIVEEDDTVIAHYEIKMVHVRRWRDINPTNILVKTYGFHLFRFQDGKIKSITGLMNIIDILTQLGSEVSKLTNSVEISDYLESLKKIFGIVDSK